MNNCGKHYVYEPFFSHVYVENDAYNHPLTNRVLHKLRHATIIPITHYKDVFNRPGQHFDKQKKSQHLILAVRKDRFLYPGAAVCDHYGYKNFYYAAQMLNCPYNCEYCYLQGLHDSANIVAFVNTADYFNAVSTLENAYVSISYDTDLLAMEPLFGYAHEWLLFSKKNAGITIEIRTKSTAKINASPLPNVILAWTVSNPLFEKGAPSIAARLTAMKSAADAGWKVRACVDPVITVPGWEKELEDIGLKLNNIKLYDISVGGFRCAEAHYKRICKRFPGSVAASLPLVKVDGVMQYPMYIIEEIKNIIKI